MDKVYEFSNHKTHEYLGGIEYYLEAKNFNSLHQIEAKVAVKTTVEPQKELSENKLAYEQRKEQNKLRKKQEKLIEKAEQEIASLEEKIFDIEEKFTAGEVSEDLQKEYAKLKRLQEQKMYEWEILSGELESM